MTPAPPQDAAPAKPLALGDVLTVGFGTTVALWAVGYVGRMPALLFPSWLIGLLMLACLITGGFIAGKCTTRGWRGGLLAGFVTALLNLLILGSLLAGDKQHPAGNPLLFLPATVLATTLIATLAALIGSLVRKPQASSLKPPNWTFRFCVVAVCATMMLLLAGGLVTSASAGLAVQDWPTSYGYNMFLYPLARMTGNIYYEHSHRLVGSLVGLTTLALTLHLLCCDKRKWLKFLAVGVFVLVCLQGWMGGERVRQAKWENAQTEGIEVSMPHDETTASAVLRVAHGVTAQLFFGLVVGLAVFCSRAWKERPATPSPGAELDRTMTLTLLILLVIQLLLGALLRHLDAAMMLHVTFASLVFLMAMATAMRVLGLHGKAQPVLRGLSVALLGVVTLQVALGIVALILRASSADAPEPTVADITSTTAHQFTGAVLLAVTVSLTLYTHRLLQPVPHEPL